MPPGPAAVIQAMGAPQGGRGQQATLDMKARIAALLKDDEDVIEILWERNRQAVLGEGFIYDFATHWADPVRPAR